MNHLMGAGASRIRCSGRARISCSGGTAGPSPLREVDRVGEERVDSLLKRKVVEVPRSGRTRRPTNARPLCTDIPFTFAERGEVGGGGRVGGRGLTARPHPRLCPRAPRFHHRADNGGPHWSASLPRGPVFVVSSSSELSSLSSLSLQGERRAGGRRGLKPQPSAPVAASVRARGRHAGRGRRIAHRRAARRSAARS
jgi:hypothetical protein